MKTGIGKRLQIAQGDRSMIGALLLQAGATGVFVGSLELVANTVFIETFGADKVPQAMMISGAAGILITTIYSYFSKQLGMRSYGIVNLVAVIMMTLVLLIGSRLLETRYLDFITFILAGPFITITLLSFSTTVRDYLSPGRIKQLAGLTEATLIGGMILAFVTIPVIVKMGVRIQDILYLGMGSLIVAAGAQLYVLTDLDGSDLRFRKRVKSTGPLRLFSYKYTALMAAFVVMGVGAAVLLHYMFLSVIESRFRGGLELVAFLGFFSAFVMFLAWIMKRFLFRWFKKRFGIKMTLLVAPVLLLLLTIMTTIAGERYGFGGEAQLFAYFFILVALSKLFIITLKESMENPSMKLIYQSLDSRERYNVQSGIEGVFSQIGVFASALFLASFVMITFVEVYHVTYILFLLLIIWFFVGMALYKRYHGMLQVTLKSDNIRDPMEQGLDEMVKVDLRKAAFPMELLEFNPYFFHYTTREQQLAMLNHPVSRVRRMIWDYILQSSPGLPELTINHLLVSEKAPEVRERIRQLSDRKLRTRLGLQEAFIRERLDLFAVERSKQDNIIGDAFHSGIRNQIFAALYQVAEEGNRKYLSEVVSLFRDKDPEIQQVAISTAGMIDARGKGIKLIDFLDHPRLYAVSWSALVRQGEKVIDDLENSFHKPEISIKLQKRIVSVLSAIGGERAVKLLLDKLDYHHREVFNAVVLGLYEIQFQASDIQVALIQNAILKMVQIGTWNMAARISVRTDDPGGSLASAIEHEIWAVNEVILMLLALIFDRSSVHRIKGSLLDRKSEDRGMAIESIDLLLSEPLKSVLLSYFYDVSVREKIDKLKEMYPVDILPTDTLIKRILNRDGIQLGDFIRISALERMGAVARFFDEQQIIAQGFHPNPKIRETAAQILRKNDPERYHLVTERLDFQDNNFPDHGDAARWYVDTTMKLTAWKLFANVGINSLFKLVSELRPFSEELLSNGDFVVLARSDSTDGLSPLASGIAFIAAYQAEILEQIRYLGTIGTCDAYLIDRRKFIELLFDERSLLHVFCDFLGQLT